MAVHPLVVIIVLMRISEDVIWTLIDFIWRDEPESNQENFFKKRNSLAYHMLKPDFSN